MKIKLKFILPMLLLTTGCGFSSALKSHYPIPPDVKNTFLNYVPPNEPVAPHDMEYIIEHSAGDGGYYGTPYFPGKLTIKKGVFFNAPIRLTNGQQIPVDEAYDLHWNLNGYAYEFYFFYPMVQNKDGNWVPSISFDVVPANAEAMVAVPELTPMMGAINQ